MIKSVKYAFITIALTLFSFMSFAQDVDEVVLTFAFPSVGQVYVNSVFRSEKPLLPVGEILSLLYIPYERNSNGLGYKGSYPNKSDVWEIDPAKLTVNKKGQVSKIESSDV